jgi:hypothetical protein
MQVEINERIIRSSLKGGKGVEMSQYVQELKEAQELIFEACKNVLKTHEENHVNEESHDITEFVKGSYVLLQYPSVNGKPKPPNKQLPFWKGPLRVEGHEGNTYHLYDFTDGKVIQRNVNMLKKFHCKKNMTDIEIGDIATKDIPDKYIVQEVISYSGDPKKLSKLRFEVRWLGYGKEHNTLEPYKNLVNNDCLHKFLRTNKMYELIPEIHRNDEDKTVLESTNKRKRGKEPNE